jgi:PAS domain S-box-containing protein
VSDTARLIEHGVAILIVEDSPTQAQRLRLILEEQGYHVSHAANGQAALDAARRSLPALIISDVVMPEMDGYELCRRLKADATLREIPVILVTTLSEPGDVVRGLECGADNFILKPYDAGYLVSRVQFVLVNREMRRHAEQGSLSVEVFFNGERHVITADRLQILNLLLSTYDAAIQRNKELTRTQDDLKLRSAELETQTETLRAVLHTVVDAIITIDERGHIQSFNPAAERLFGYTASEVTGKNVSCLMPDPPASVHDGYRQRYLQTGQARIIGIGREVEARRKDGTLFPADLGVSEGGLNGRRFFTGILRDITERKASERALAAAKLEAERANRAKSDFLSRMSHDLRTPLNAILGFAQLLELDGLNTEQHEGVRHILKGGAHLLELINEVLDIARIESGHLALSPEPVAVGDVVQRVLELVGPLAAQRGITFDSEATRICGSCHVLADRQRLSQVLLNLLSNAVKYNREGGAVIVRCEDAPGQRMRIMISDMGAGIPPGKLQLLFQPFERLGAEQTGVEGTGLGLMLSKGLTEAMGGTLGVESEVDRGSTFWVELPVADSAAEGASMVPARSARAVPDSGVTGSVLYIEDNISNRRLMERVLARRPGVRLVGAAEGQAGLDLARTDRPDLILLDLHLADMHGEEVLRRLWEDLRTRTIPVAVLSADATPAQTRRLLASGAVAYLTKPLDVSLVLQLLDETLTK